MLEKRDMTDHELAAFLREHNATDNHLSRGNCTTWYSQTNDVVALAFYDNAACTREIWVNTRIDT